jgi:hypothetical protein
MLKWVRISDDNPNHGSMSTGLFRAKVLAGWLIYSSTLMGVTMTFYPDPKHEWNGSSLE